MKVFRVRRPRSTEIVIKKFTTKAKLRKDMFLWNYMWESRINFLFFQWSVSFYVNPVVNQNYFELWVWGWGQSKFPAELFNLKVLFEEFPKLPWFFYKKMLHKINNIVSVYGLHLSKTSHIIHCLYLVRMIWPFQDMKLSLLNLK